MSSDALLLVAALVAIVFLDLAAMRFGADSRQDQWLNGGRRDI